MADNILLGLATMSGKENIAFSLQNLGFDNYFGTVTGAHMVKKGKPDPEVFERTMDQMGVSPAESIIFEDSRTGVLGARATGAKVIGITSGHTSDELHSWGADHVINDYQGLTLRFCRELLNSD